MVEFEAALSFMEKEIAATASMRRLEDFSAEDAKVLKIIDFLNFFKDLWIRIKNLKNF